MERQSLEFAQLVFGLAVVRSFLAVLSFLPFGLAVYVLCHCMLEVYDLLFDFDFTGVTVKRLP